MCVSILLRLPHVGLSSLLASQLRSVYCCLNCEVMQQQQHDIWAEYIQVVKSGEASSTWEEQHICVCRRVRRDCWSSADLACSQRRGRVESRVTHSSGARYPTLLFSLPFVVALDVHRQPSNDSPTPSPTPLSATHCMSVSPFPALPATAPYSGSTISTTTTTTKSPPTLASIVKSATPPSLPQLPPPVAASPPALRRTSPTQSRDEDQSMDQSMSDSKPALASPPPTLSHTALPASTASAIAGSPGSSASPKPLHSNSTSSPLLNHAAQLTAAQAPFQLALLLFPPRLQTWTHSVASLPSRRAAPLAPSAFWCRSKACLLAILLTQMWTKRRPMGRGKGRKT
ncbi:hypothetical protein DFH11DRAFT_851178 [Phellopilus nigrolimitatus]|nr:hypothetical protein DFH11DRAFT_851178 [Phellopilus nigrolimitatus]